MAIFVTAYQDMTEQQFKEKEKVHRKQAKEIVELKKQKNLLEDTVKKQEIEIEMLKGQQNVEKPIANGDELTDIEKRQISRYA